MNMSVPAHTCTCIPVNMYPPTCTPKRKKSENADLSALGAKASVELLESLNFIFLSASWDCWCCSQPIPNLGLRGARGPRRGRSVAHSSGSPGLSWPLQSCPG